MRDYLRPDEVDAMVQAARKAGRHPVRDAAIILMMFRHGLRTAELVVLRWHQVDLQAGYLDVQLIAAKCITRIMSVFLHDTSNASLHPCASFSTLSLSPML